MRLSIAALVFFACQPPTKPKEETPPPTSAAWAFTPEPSVQKMPIKIVQQAPMALTASDGTGLHIAKLDARGVIEAPIAFTELHMVFDNPRDQQIEGQFRITLPERASVSRFAMLTNGAWQEGEVVERQAARRAYEDFLHRRQDPALLEQQEGNEFSARIFPIPARGQKEIIISYAEELTGAPYKITLLGLPELTALDAHVQLGEKTFELHEAHITPKKDFVVEGAEGTGVALRKDNLVVARVTPMTEVAQDQVSSLFVLLDTSASRTLGHEQDVALLKDLLAGMKAPVTIWAFDQVTQKVKSLDDLQGRRPLGASNLEQALLAVAKSGEKFKRGLIVGDGVVTAGASKLQDAVLALKANGVERIDALAVGGIRDQAALARIVRGVLPNEGLVIDGTLPLELIAKKLNHKARSGIKVDVPGADWVWPETLDGMQPGEQALVYADLPAEKPFSVSLDGKPVGPGTMKSATRPLLERAWVAARIKKLMSQADASKDRDFISAINKQVVEMSTKFRVLSPLTALLVLETEHDYARFGIDRKALADILIVDGKNVALMSRKGPPQKIAAPIARNKRLDVASQPKTDPGAPMADKGGEDRKMKKEASRGRADAKDMDDLSTSDGVGGAPAEKSARAEPRPAPAPAAPPPPPAAASAGAAAPPRPAREESRTNAIRLSESASEGEADELQGTPRPSQPRPETVVAEQQPMINPYTGPFLGVMTKLKKNDKAGALTQAETWWRGNPGDVMALVALGEVCEAQGELDEAARAYGSLIDLFPARADMRRFAGLRLERLKNENALALATDTYAKALEERPDHPQSHRLLAYALLKQNQAEKAFEILAKGAAQHYPEDRFRGVDRIFAEDLGLAAQVWIKTAPDRRDEILKRLSQAGGRRESAPSLRFVLSWETDANDVDFHIYDGKGGHAYYASQQLESGGELYADVTTGYGPECFTIRGKQRAYPYKLQAHYYSRGPMGYGMGKLQIVQHDGAGTLTFEERPFIVMQDQAFLDLGKVTRPL